MASMLFDVFATVALLGGVGVLVAPHPVHSVLFLVLVFCNAAGLLLLIEAEVLALLFLVVYVGAIAVLFLFVVMMLDLKRTPLRAGHVFPVLPAAVLLVVRFLGELLLVIEPEGLGTLEQRVPGLLVAGEYQRWVTQVDPLVGLQPLGQVLYTHFLAHLLIGGLILLVALVGAIVLVLPVRKLRHASVASQKRQLLMHQLSRREDAARFLVDF